MQKVRKITWFGLNCGKGSGMNLSLEPISNFMESSPGPVIHVYAETLSATLSSEVK